MGAGPHPGHAPEAAARRRAESGPRHGRGPRFASRLARHRQAASCATCHKQIDPPGYALENYDAIGGWRGLPRAGDRGSPRTRSFLARSSLATGRLIAKGAAVEAGDTLADGRKFADLAGLKKLLSRIRTRLPGRHRKAGGVRDRERAGIRRPRRGRTDRGPDARAEVWSALAGPCRGAKRTLLEQVK